MKKTVTIFTPSYNRAYTLVNLYESLVNQTSKEFTWLIVDDGSDDNTYELVKEWIKEAKINIKYIYQINSGKHVAHNNGVCNCETEYFFCVDSDDYLLENAVQDILYDIKRINNIDIAGIVSLKLNESRKPVGTFFPKDIRYSNLSDLYEKYKFRGDTALIFKTSVLKQYPFPLIKGEKFIGEEYIYSQIDAKYKLYISEKSYYICQYLEDGYTANMFKLIAQNPKGYMILKKMKLAMSKSVRVKYKAAALYIVGCWLSKQRSIIKSSPNKTITILAVPLALIVYWIRFRRLDCKES